MPMSEAEHVTRSLMEIQMKFNVVAYIQCFRTLVYKVLTMTQDEAFLLFIREQIGFHVQEDLGQAMVMAEKADVWRAQSKGGKNGQSEQKSGGNRSGKQGQQNCESNKKATVE